MSEETAVVAGEPTTAAEVVDALDANPVLPRGIGDEPTGSDIESGVSDDSQPTDDDGFKPITSQQDFEAALKSRLERAKRSAEKQYAKQVEELSSKLREYEEAQLSAEERKDKRLTELEQNLQEATERYTKLERTRLVESLAREMGLPEKFWNRVQGTTDDEIISDINDMLEGLPRNERQPGVFSQSPQVVNVQATNSEPELEESPKAIVDKLGSMFSF